MHYPSTTQRPDACCGHQGLSPEPRPSLKEAKTNRHCKRGGVPSFGLAVLLCLLTSGAAARSQSSAAAAAPNSAPASIHGVVAGRNGELYQGVLVALSFAGKPSASRSQTTDSDGVFNFSGLPAGAFKLTVSGGGFETKTLSGLLHAGEIYDARTIVLSPASSASVQVTATRAEIEVEQVQLEEKQRVLGFIPNFYVTYVPNAPPLSTRQKYAMAWKTATDPFTWMVVGIFAGVEQADGSFSGYGPGAQGYAKRFGAEYADTLTGTFLGSAVLPSLFRQDPRYFYKGTGTARSRTLYALANAVVCKGDNGRWQANYSGILGSLAAGGISNLYYPAGDRNGAALTFEQTGLSIGGSAVANLFQEFVVRKLTPRVPRYRQDAP